MPLKIKIIIKLIIIITIIIYNYVSIPKLITQRYLNVYTILKNLNLVFIILSKPYLILYI